MSLPSAQDAPDVGLDAAAHADVELTRLCAEAMGLMWDDERQCVEREDGSFWLYSPLTDDKQAMQMVKRFGLVCDPQHDGQDFASDPGWEVWHPSLGEYLAISPDLNRAIVECVANLRRHATSTRQQVSD